MNSFGIDIGQIAELGTQVGITGAIRMGEMVADDVFELIVSVVAIVYEADPGIF